MSARTLAAEADAARLRAHIDAAGDGANLPALLDLYHDRAERAEADAARWRKVAPLIERLADDVRRRELIARAEFDRRVSDTVTALLAATQEPTP